MDTLRTIASGVRGNPELLGEREKISVYYHNLFDYPLTFADLIKWNVSSKIKLNDSDKIGLGYRRGYYFISGRENLVYKRTLKERISAKKMQIAAKASQVLSKLPSVKMVAVTGSLAMANAGEESDIDLMLVTKSGWLWTTRILSYFLLKTFGFAVRRFGEKEQRDKLCLNIWLDEYDLIWKTNDRNTYTAHEICQIVPLIDKDKIYEKFLLKNKWVKNYWPNAVKIKKIKNTSQKRTNSPIFLEKAAYRLQFAHMKNKISREIISPTRAIFHPQDWAKMVLSRFST